MQTMMMCLLGISLTAKRLRLEDSSVCVVCAAQSRASDVVDDWDTVKVGPELAPVTPNASTTALLILDISKNGPCASGPRCVDTIPKAKRLYRCCTSRGSHDVVQPQRPPEDMIVPGVLPRDGECADQRGPDKFLGSDLEAKLKAGSIKTVVVGGTSFQGVGIGTGSEAAQQCELLVADGDKYRV